MQTNEIMTSIVHTSICVNHSVLFKLTISISHAARLVDGSYESENTI